MIGNFEYMDKYVRLSKADFFIFGVCEYDVVRAFIIKDFDSDFLNSIAKLEKGVNRFAPNKKQIELLRERAQEVVTICTTKNFIEKVEKAKQLNPKENNGTVFEALCSAYFNAPQQNDELFPFYCGGDLLFSDGTQAQVKFNKGKFSTFEEIDSILKRL